MAGEQDTAVKALQIAIQMEIDGKEFYLQSSGTSKNELGKKLFAQLAREEDVHRQAFENIFNNISASQGWPASNISYDSGRKLRTLFAEALEAKTPNDKADSAELYAVQTAMDMENKTYDFYKERSGKTTSGVEKQFYEELAAQEKEHHLVLLDYFEFLKNPAAWFVEKEHPSIDGG